MHKPLQIFSHFSMPVPIALHPLRRPHARIASSALHLHLLLPMQLTRSEDSRPQPPRLRNYRALLPASNRSSLCNIHQSLHNQRENQMILDEPTHSTPSPGIIVSQSTRPSASHTAITTSFQPPHMRAASYTQISTIAPGPFSPTAAPQLYVPHIPPPMSLPPVPAPANIVPQSPMIMSPWPAVTPTSYQIPPTLPPQQYFTGPPLSLEQLMHQRLQHINYPSGIEYRLIKNCLPDQPLNFFKTNVPSQAPVPRAEPPEQLRPFKEPTSEVSAEIIQSLPHLPQLIQTLEVPFEAQRSTATQAETTRGPRRSYHFISCNSG